VHTRDTCVTFMVNTSSSILTQNWEGHRERETVQMIHRLTNPPELKILHHREAKVLGSRGMIQWKLEDWSLRVEHED